MRKIGIRQFQQNFHKEIKELPFTVTRDGKDYCIVAGIEYPNLKSKLVVTKSGNKTVDVIPHVEDITPKDKLVSLALYGDENAVVTKTTFPDGTTKTELDKVFLTGKCQVPNTTCKSFGKKYLVIYPSDEGETKKEVFLCDFHVKKSRDNNIEVFET